VLASAVRDALGVTGSIARLPLTPARVRALAEVAGSTGHGPSMSADLA